eukprot:jgi/Bigna1/76223/fgenesh1_pg.40_\
MATVSGSIAPSAKKERIVVDLTIDDDETLPSQPKKKIKQYSESSTPIEAVAAKHESHNECLDRVARALSMKTPEVFKGGFSNRRFGRSHESVDNGFHPAHIEDRKTPDYLSRFSVQSQPKDVAMAKAPCNETSQNMRKFAIMQQNCKNSYHSYDQYPYKIHDLQTSSPAQIHPQRIGANDKENYDPIRDRRTNDSKVVVEMLSCARRSSRNHPEKQVLPIIDHLNDDTTTEEQRGKITVVQEQTEECRHDDVVCEFRDSKVPFSVNTEQNTNLGKIKKERGTTTSETAVVVNRDIEKTNFLSPTMGNTSQAVKYQRLNHPSKSDGAVPKSSSISSLDVFSDSSRLITSPILKPPSSLSSSSPSLESTKAVVAANMIISIPPLPIVVASSGPPLGNNNNNNNNNNNSLEPSDNCTDDDDEKRRSSSQEKKLTMTSKMMKIYPSVADLLVNGLTFTICKHVWLIGCGASCDVICHDDPLVLHIHCEVRVDCQQKIWLKSSGDTFVNGKLISRHTNVGISKNDTIRIGKYELKIKPTLRCDTSYWEKFDGEGAQQQQQQKKLWTYIPEEEYSIGQQIWARFENEWRSGTVKKVRGARTVCSVDGVLGTHYDLPIRATKPIELRLWNEEDTTTTTKTTSDEHKKNVGLVVGIIKAERRSKRKRTAVTRLTLDEEEEQEEEEQEQGQGQDQDTSTQKKKKKRKRGTTTKKKEKKKNTKRRSKNEPYDDDDNDNDVKCNYDDEEDEEDREEGDCMMTTTISTSKSNFQVIALSDNDDAVAAQRPPRVRRSTFLSLKILLDNFIGYEPSLHQYLPRQFCGAIIHRILPSRTFSDSQYAVIIRGIMERMQQGPRSLSVHLMLQLERMHNLQSFPFRELLPDWLKMTSIGDIETLSYDKKICKLYGLQFAFDAIKGAHEGNIYQEEDLKDFISKQSAFKLCRGIIKSCGRSLEARLLAEKVMACYPFSNGTMAMQQIAGERESP